MKEVTREGGEEREAPRVTAAVDKVEEEVCDVQTSTSAALIAEAIDIEQINLRYLLFNHT